MRHDPDQLGVQELRQAHPGLGGSHLQFPMNVVGHIADLDHLGHPFTIVHVEHMRTCAFHVQRMGGVRQKRDHADPGSSETGGRSGEDGVEEAFGRHFAEHGNDERDGGDEQSRRRSERGCGPWRVSGCVANLVVQEEEIPELL